MSIKDNPDRVVRTKDSIIAFIGHKLQTDENILLEAIVDQQTNAVSFRSSSKAKYGIDFVEANEDVQPLIDITNKLVQEQVEAGQGIPGVQPDHSVFNTKDLKVEHEGEGKHKHVKG